MFCLLICCVFMLLFVDIILKGVSHFSWSFFTKLPSEDFSEANGVAQAIIGSFLTLFFASLISIPLSIFMGVFLAENQKSTLATLTRSCVDTLFGIPSIVIGIVVYLCFVLPFGQFSLLSASIALSLLFIPILTKATE